MRRIKYAFFVALMASFMFVGFVPTTANALPLSGGGNVYLDAPGDFCQGSVRISGVPQTVVMEAIVYPTNSNETPVYTKQGVNPELKFKVPQGDTSITQIEVVKSGSVIYKARISMSCNVNVYTTPGEHFVNGRMWKTICEPYSVTTRCRTNIWATSGGWEFNNLTYLPSARGLWTSNPLGGYGRYGYLGEWTSGGLKWRVQCDTAATGKGACRSYTQGTNGFWRINNIVLFK